MQQVKQVDQKTQKLLDVVYENANDSMGFVPNSMRTMPHEPKLFFGFSMMSLSIFSVPTKKLFHFKRIIPLLKFLKWGLSNDKETISLELRSLVAFASSISSGCMYCQAHMGAASSKYGASQEKLDNILNFEDSELYSEPEKAAISIAFSAARVPNETTSEHFSRLRKYFDDRQIVNIVGVISYFGFLNRWNDTMSTQLEPETTEFGNKSLGALDWNIGDHDAAFDPAKAK